MAEAIRRTDGRNAGKSPLLRRVNSAPDKKLTFIGLAVIVFAAGLLVSNIFFGMGQGDERFYYTVPYRILLGDAMFVNEWHVSQLSSFFYYPLVWLFLKVNGSADGIIIFMRSVFVVCQTGLSCFVFLKMRKYGFLSALSGALLFLLYYPEYIPALNYYTVSMYATLIASLMIVFADRISAKTLPFIGILLAFAVLAEPPFAAVYFIWLIAVIVSAALKKGRFQLLTVRSFLLATAGVLVVAAAFFAFLFSQETPAQFISALPNIFRTGEYSSGTLLGGYPAYAASLFQSFSWVAPTAAVFIIIIIIDKKRAGRKRLWAAVGFVLAAACVICSVVTALINGKSVEFYHIPCVIAFIGIFSYILSDNKDRRLLALWITGFSYSLLLAVVSEAMMFVGSYGFVLSGIASVPMTIRLLEELRDGPSDLPAKRSKTTAGKSNGSVSAYRALSVCLAAVLVFSVGIYSATLLSFDPMGNADITSKITEPAQIDRGPYKGVYASRRQKDGYDAILRDIGYIEEHTDSEYTVCSTECWYIFTSDRRPLAYSLWFDMSAGETFFEYYDYVNRIPKYVYIAREILYMEPDSDLYKHAAGFIDTVLDSFTSRFDCEITDGEAGYILKVNGYNES